MSELIPFSRKIQLLDPPLHRFCGDTELFRGHVCIHDHIPPFARYSTMRRRSLHVRQNKKEFAKESGISSKTLRFIQFKRKLVGIEEKVNRFPVSGSVLIGSVPTPFSFNSLTAASRSFTVKARCRRPAASGLVGRSGGSGKENNSIAYAPSSARSSL